MKASKKLKVLEILLFLISLFFMAIPNYILFAAPYLVTQKINILETTTDNLVLNKKLKINRKYITKGVCYGYILRTVEVLCDNIHYSVSLDSNLKICDIITYDENFEIQGYKINDICGFDKLSNWTLDRAKNNKIRSFYQTSIVKVKNRRYLDKLNSFTYIYIGSNVRYLFIPALLSLIVILLTLFKQIRKIITVPAHVFINLFSFCGITYLIIDWIVNGYDLFFI